MHQMPEIITNMRLSALFLTSNAASRWNKMLWAALKEDSAPDTIEETIEPIAQ